MPARNADAPPRRRTDRTADLLCARTLDAAERGLYIAPDYSGRSGFPKPPSEMRCTGSR